MAEKGLEWESKHISLRKAQNLDPEYVKLNPMGVVPTLIHDGKVLNESNFIMEYLDEIFPNPPLTPPDPFVRAQMRIWMDKCENRLHKNINIVSFIKQGRFKRYEGLSDEEKEELYDKQPSLERRSILRKRIENGVSEEEIKLAEDIVATVLDEMEVRLQDRPWLCGDAVTLADISIAPFIERFEANKMPKLTDWVLRPHLGKWWQEIQKREAFKTGFYFTNPDVEI